MFIFWVNLGMWPLKSIVSEKASTVMRVSTHIYGVSKEIDGKTFITSFVYNTKRPSVKQSMKQQVSSNFQIYPWGGKSDPPCLVSKSEMVTTALHYIQLYVLSRNERALWSRSKTWNELKFSDLPLGDKSDPPAFPHLKLPEDRVNSLLFNVTNESPFKTDN